MALCREFFAEWGISRFPKEATCPTVQTQPELHERAQTDVQTLWKIATNTNRDRMTQKKFLNFVKKLRELHRLQIDGVLLLKGSANTHSAVE